MLILTDAQDNCLQIKDADSDIVSDDNHQACAQFSVKDTSRQQSILHYSKDAWAKDTQHNRWERMMGQCDNLSWRTYYH
jgi:hypothetical protein